MRIIAIGPTVPMKKDPWRTVLMREKDGYAIYCEYNPGDDFNKDYRDRIEFNNLVSVCNVFKQIVSEDIAAIQLIEERHG